MTNDRRDINEFTITKRYFLGGTGDKRYKISLKGEIIVSANDEAHATVRIGIRKELFNIEELPNEDNTAPAITPHLNKNITWINETMTEEHHDKTMSQKRKTPIFVCGACGIAFETVTDIQIHLKRINMKLYTTNDRCDMNEFGKAYKYAIQQSHSLILIHNWYEHDNETRHCMREQLIAKAWKKT